MVPYDSGLLHQKLRGPQGDALGEKVKLYDSNHVLSYDQVTNKKCFISTSKRETYRDGGL